jgi:thioredoxin reductase
MKVEETLDCLIIGSGPEAKPPAVYLARYRQSVAVDSKGKSRRLYSEKPALSRIPNSVSSYSIC